MFFFFLAFENISIKFGVDLGRILTFYVVDFHLIDIFEYPTQCICVDVNLEIAFVL